MKAQEATGVLLAMFMAFIYCFVLFALIGIVSTFVIAPLLGLARYGVFNFNPEMVFSLKGLALIAVFALGLSLPVSLWTQWEMYRERKTKESQGGR